MATYQDYYARLGVERTADEKAIAAAYKKLAKKYHPDLNQGDPRAEEKFKEINEAYEVLKDPKKRRYYDQLGSNWQQGQQFEGFGGGGQGGFDFGGFDFGGAGGTGFSDFFESLFGRGGFGGQGSFGQGGFGGGPFGQGGFGRGTFGQGGFGGASRGQARSMRGADVEAEISLTLEEVQQGGRRAVSLRGRQLEVNIPAGVKDGGKIRLAGMGEPGISAPGDVLLRVRHLPHSVFREDGQDLACDVAVAPWEAVLGATVQVPTLEGPVDMKIPAGTDSGKKFRIRGRGLGPAGRRGDLFAVVCVRVPRRVSEEERALWRRLADASGFRPRG